jgi:membrane carboxypeptidase/penicillin-binding protein PbpC
MTHNPHNLHRGEGEHGKPTSILEAQSDKQGARLRNVLRQDVQDKLLNVVKDAAALLDGSHDRGKVVVREYNVGGVLGDIRAREAHRDAYVGAAERGRVVDTVTSLLKVLVYRHSCQEETICVCNSNEAGGGVK